MATTKTWPYGTQRRAKVLDVVTRRGGRTLIVGDDANEAHILVGTGSQGSKGDEGVIEFLQGGPMGGYWKFTKTTKAASA